MKAIKHIPGTHNQIDVNETAPKFYTQKSAPLISNYYVVTSTYGHICNCWRLVHAASLEALQT